MRVSYKRNGKQNVDVDETGGDGDVQTDWHRWLGSQALATTGMIMRGYMKAVRLQM